MEQTTQEFFNEIRSRINAYTVVFLTKGTNRDQNEETANQIQMEHLKYLNKLRDEGMLPIHGPLVDDGNVVGIAIYNSSDPVQVKKWIEEDPGYKAGRFGYEIHPFFTFPNSMLP